MARQKIAEALVALERRVQRLEEATGERTRLFQEALRLANRVIDKHGCSHSSVDCFNCRAYMKFMSEHHRALRA